MSNLYHIRFKSPTSDSCLQHFGIKGQKWGVRRFQEEDGSYTAAGRERYGIGDDRESKKFMKLANASNGYGKSAEKAHKKLLKTKKMKQLLSDKEINEKKEAYKKASDEYLKVSKGEDYDAYSEDYNYGLNKKQFEQIKKLQDKKYKAYNELTSTVQKKVNDFVGNHAQQSVSKIKSGKTKFDDVNKWINIVANVEVLRPKK